MSKPFKANSTVPGVLAVAVSVTAVLYEAVLTVFKEMVDAVGRVTGVEAIESDDTCKFAVSVVNSKV
jgi:hypothetical protein